MESTKKLCPIMSTDMDCFCAEDNCQWFDAEGRCCAVRTIMLTLNNATYIYEARR